jgi:(4S)-4-hydroxy-5-phosphonooxypentane-2,3-dione isomerase
MLIVHILIHVSTEWEEEFKRTTVEFARNSSQEPGVTRFDFIQQQNDPSRFVLVQVYNSYEDQARHKDTDHYQRWQDDVAHMMAEPRVAIKYFNIHPYDEGWE